MENLTLDYIIREDIPLYQNKNHFRFNTDTKLLAQFMKIKKDDVILDIGTNNGALLRIADLQPIKKSIGVEVLPEAYEIALLNAKSFFSHPNEMILSRIQDIEMEPVNVIVCNPPYFQEKETNPSVVMTPRQFGRIEKNLTLEELIYHAGRLLKSNGRFYFVHRPYRLNDIHKLLYQNHFQLRHIQVAYERSSGQAKSILIEAIKESGCHSIIDPPIFI
ncbi:MAG: methyltransferase [Erysipelotrichaceae bacterium]|nr:methyltransferase [Erysipelotrichaceae bacterium]